MPRFSIVVPTYNGAAHIRECLASALGQGPSDLEVIVVDDLSSDDTAALARTVAAADPRVRVIERDENGGTLRARRDGVLASKGDYVLLLDQDDELAPGALEAVDAALAAASDPDILHFGVRVVAENDAASQAAAGMAGFLTPQPRRLEKDEILVAQFAETGGFDWHVHHKALRGELARRAWGSAADVRLTLSDDLYASLMLCSLARSYVAVADAPWYVYHLGRGETFGEALTLADVRSMSERDLAAWELARAFAASGAAPRPDWPERLADVRDRLAEHVMNELHDGLPRELWHEAHEAVLERWPADAVAAELCRFVRDRAYALYDARSYPAPDDELHELVSEKRRACALVEGEGSRRYREMRAAAERHLADLEALRPARGPLAALRSLLRRPPRG